jgi:CBS domain-containing protein
MVQVKDFCSREVATVEPLASLRSASLLMRNRHVGTLVVVDDSRRPTGIITDRDIVVAVIAVPGARPEGIRVCDAMQTALALVGEDDGVFEAVQKMRDRGVRRLPVVARDGTLAGIVSADDVLGVLCSELARLVGALGRAAGREATERRPLDVA